VLRILVNYVVGRRNPLNSLRLYSPRRRKRPWCRSRQWRSARASQASPSPSGSDPYRMASRWCRVPEGSHRPLGGVSCKNIRLSSDV